MLNRRFLPAGFAFVLGTPLLAALGGGGFSWIWAVLGISFLIAVHEMGHYLACVATKTRTETFSIGFGPRLFGWERDRNGKRRFTVGTRQLDPDDHAMDFRIAAVPLGGYVKMAGGEIMGESHSDDPNEFINKSASARIFIVSAGVIMNVITAYLLFGLAFANGRPVGPATIGAVVPGGAAWRAGLEPGDEILSIDGMQPRLWLDIKMEIVLASQGERIPLRVRRGTRELPLQVLPVYQEEGGFLAIEAAPAVKLTIGEGETALQIGYAEPATVNGWPVRGGLDAQQAIERALRGGATSVRVAHAGGQTVTISLVPGSEAPEGTKPPTAKVGIEPYMRFTISDLRAQDAAEVHVGDELRAVVVKGVRYEIESPSSLDAARMRWPVDAVVVAREGEETTLPLALETAAAARRFFDGVGLKPGKRGSRVRALRAGHLLRADAGGIWQYPSSPAAEAGLLPGDEILAVGDTKTENWDAILAAVRKAAAAGPFALTLRTPGAAERTIELTPVDLVYVGDIELGVVKKEPIHLDGGTREAFSIAFRATGREIGNVFRTIRGLFSGSISFNKNIAGPITLVRASEHQAQAGLASLLWFLGYISVMLAVLNILPIPVLDGGHLLFILIEKVKGSPLKEAVMARAMYVGLFLLLTLMFFAFKNDISAFF